MPPVEGKVKTSVHERVAPLFMGSSPKIYVVVYVRVVFSRFFPCEREVEACAFFGKNRWGFLSIDWEVRKRTKRTPPLGVEV